MPILVAIGLSSSPNPVDRVRDQFRSNLERARVEHFDRLNSSEALRFARLAVEEDPSSADARFFLGVMLDWNEHYEEALAAYRMTIELDPSHEEAAEAVEQTERHLAHPERNGTPGQLRSFTGQTLRPPG